MTGCALALWATGIVTLQESLAGFGDPATVFVASLFVASAALEKTRELSDDHKVSWTLTLVRTTAKYLLTACDRLRRTALQQAWSIRALTPAELLAVQRWVGQGP